MLSSSWQFILHAATLSDNPASIHIQDNNNNLLFIALNVLKGL